MIGMIRGRLVDRLPSGEVLIDVGGVGYRVVVAPATLTTVAPPGEEIVLHTHLHVREDALILYGFPTRDERVCFEALIGARGVGPALALAILSVHSPSSLRRLLAEGDVDALTLVPGVGKKTAAKLVLELASRLDVPDLADLDELVRPGPRATSARRDVGDALTGLGYSPEEIRSVLSDLSPEGEAEELLREALHRLASARR
jgi:Holliday junction DNA helicase RuvA